MHGAASIAVLSPFVGGDYYGAIIAGAHGAARSAGGRVLAIQTLPPGSGSADEAGVPDFRIPVAWDHVAGFLVLPGAVDDTFVADLRTAGKPVVLVGHRLPGSDCPVVLTDNRVGVVEAVAHLLTHGHERIGFSGYLGATDVRERYDAYREAMRAHGMPADSDLFFAAADNHESGGREVAQRLHADGMPVTALVLGTDRNALGLMASLHADGHRLPQDLAVVGFDDIGDDAFVEPSLSSVRQPLDGLGAAGHAMLIGLLTGAPAPQQEVRAPSVYVGRDSCGCPGGGLRVSEAQTRKLFADNQDLHLALNTQYGLAIELLQTQRQDPRDLAWLARTPATGGCLGLWRDDDPTGRRQPPHPDFDEAVQVVAAYPPGLEVPQVGAELPVRAFPPERLLSLPRADRNEMVFVVPVAGGERAWGVLAAVARIQDGTPPGREMMNHAGSLLAVALEHDLMLRSLREQEDRLRRTALYDQLTGLPNRTLLLDRLALAEQRAVRHEEQRYAILFIDLDGFKGVNDTYGHATGDALLVEVARRLAKVVRPTDTAARFGGDEFVLLLEDLPPDGVPDSVVERVTQVLEEPVLLAGRTMRMSGSIGVALSVAGGTRAGTLLRLADQEMYRAKGQRRPEPSDD